MDLSVVVLTYNSQDGIKESLNSMLKYLPTRCEVIVVDNHSTDATAEILRATAGIKFIESEQNLGFAKGMNLGAKEAEGKYLLLLNPDTLVGEGVLEKMLAFIQQNDSIGILAPKIVLPSGQTQASATRLPTLWRALKRYWLGDRSAYGQYVPDVEQPVQVEAVYGAALMVPRALFQRVKGFDTRYFLYFEDLDLCRRISRLGYSVIYYPVVSVGHSLGKSTGSLKKLPLGFGIRTLANFWPIKRSGANYYLVQSSYIYHGFLIGFLINLVIFIGLKLRYR